MYLRKIHGISFANLSFLLRYWKYANLCISASDHYLGWWNNTSCQYIARLAFCTCTFRNSKRFRAPGKWSYDKKRYPPILDAVKAFFNVCIITEGFTWFFNISPHVVTVNVGNLTLTSNLKSTLTWNEKYFSYRCWNFIPLLLKRGTRSNEK